MTTVYRIVLFFEASLLKDTVECAARHVNARMTGDAHQTGFLVMFKVAMTATGADQIPAIVLDELDDIAHFHAERCNSTQESIQGMKWPDRPKFNKG